MLRHVIKMIYHLFNMKSVARRFTMWNGLAWRRYDATLALAVFLAVRPLGHRREKSEHSQEIRNDELVGSACFTKLRRDLLKSSPLRRRVGSPGEFVEHTPH